MKNLSVALLLFFLPIFVYGQDEDEKNFELPTIEANLATSLKSNDTLGLKKWAGRYIQYQKEMNMLDQKASLEKLFTISTYYRKTANHSNALWIDETILGVMESDYDLTDLSLVKKLDELKNYYQNSPGIMEERIWEVKVRNAENVDFTTAFFIYWDAGNHYYQKLNYEKALSCFANVYDNPEGYLKNKTIEQNYWLYFLGDYCTLVAFTDNPVLLAKITQKLSEHCALLNNLKAQIYFNTIKGECLMTKGQADSARYYSERSFDLITESKKAKATIRLMVLEDLIDACVESEDMRSAERAIVLAEQLVSDCEKEGGQEILIRYYENTAEYYTAIHNHEKTLKTLQQAVKYAEKSASQNAIGYNFLLLKMSLAYVRLNDTENAKKALVKPSLLFSEKTSQQSPEYASFCNYKAIYFDKVGNKDSAGFYFKKGYQTYLIMEGPNSRNTLVNLLNLSRYQLERGNYQEAEVGYKLALNGFLQFYSERHSLVTDALSGLASACFYQKDYDASRRNLSWMRNNILFSIENNFSFLTEQERKEYYDDLSENLQNYYFLASSMAVNPDLASGNVLSEEIFLTLLISKGLLLRSGEQFKQALIDTKDPLLLEKYNAWKRVKTTIGKYHTLSFEQQKSSEINLTALTTEAATLEKELARVSLKEDLLNVGSRLTYPDITNSLKENEALVEIIRTKERFSGEVAYTALIATNGSAIPMVIILKEGKKMENQYLKYYLNGIKFKTTDTVSYRVYLTAIVDSLTKRNCKKVYISADGVYHQVSLGSLYIPATKNYLLDKLDVRLISSSKDLLQNPPTVFNPTKSFLFGNPDFNNEKSGTQDTTRSVDVNGTVFHRLPGTSQEVKTIREVLSGTDKTITLYEATEANEVKVKSIRDVELLHIATHGYFKESGKGFSVSNAMLSSGLIMAGAGDFIKNNTRIQGEDGFLTAYEISLQNYEKIQLVVLSACETGKGVVYAGDGVFGLQRAFYQAGADNLLMSLWKVDDAATRDLMISFYKNLKDKKEIHEAYVSAMKEMKLKYKHPYYWGAFVLIQNSK